MTLRQVQETKSYKTSIETDTDKLLERSMLLSNMEYKRLLESAREKKKSLGLGSFEHLCICPKAIIGKNPIPKEKQIATFLDEHHFSLYVSHSPHPQPYAKLGDYSPKSE